MQSIIDANASLRNYEIIQHPLQRGEDDDWRRDRSCLPASVRVRPPRSISVTVKESKLLLTLQQRSTLEPHQVHVENGI